MNLETTSTPWYTNLRLVIGVILTVVMALLMSQLDDLQTRIIPTVPVVVRVTEPVLTSTPLSAIALATAVPPSPTPIGFDEAAAAASSAAVPAEEQCGPPPASWVPYRVQPGDTLYALSLKTDSTVDEITRVNCLVGLVSGTQIFLPKAIAPTIVCGPPDSWVRYTVQPGDTLYSLAQSRNISVFEAMKANCMVSSKLFAGRQVYLPPLPATAVPPTNTPRPRPTNTRRPPASSTPPPVVTSTPTVPTMTPTITSTAVTNTPTSTATPSSTATATMTPTATSASPTFTPTHTATAVPPTNTPTPQPPTATNTPLPPTFTATPQPPTATNTPLPTATDTPVPPTPTETPTP